MPKFKNILLIDDDEDYLYLVSHSLAKLKLFETIHSLKSGNEALNYITESCARPLANTFPDVIFVDNQMPGMNGFAFLEKLNSIPGILKEKLRIYMVSAFTNEVDMERLGKYKVQGFINKPLTLDKLKKIFSSEDAV
ncbi:MAG TPA: response regulator [Panacibacter sp.]|nr:response regulator [Panacibacter sp.]